MHSKLNIIIKIMFFVSLAIVSSCESFSKKNRKKPEILLESINLLDIQNNILTAEVILNVKNQNSFLITITSFSSEVYINGQLVSTADNIGIINLFANEFKIVKPVFLIDLEQLNQIIDNSKLSDSINYTIQGNVSFFGFTVPYALEGVIQKPTFKIAKFDFNDTDKEHIICSITLQIKNLSDLNAYFKDLKFEFFAFDKILFSADYQLTNPILGQSSFLIDLNVKLSKAALDDLFLDLVHHRGNLRYKFRISNQNNLIDESYGTIAIPMNNVFRRSKILEFFNY